MSLRSAKVVPGAASTLLLGMITGPVRDLTVVAISPYAVYAVAARSRESPRLLAIGSPRALRMPFMIVSDVLDEVALGQVTVGDRVRAGAGRVATGSSVIMARRWWVPPRVEAGAAPTPESVDAVEALLRERPIDDGPFLQAQAARLAEAADRPAAMRALVGRGRGTTPSGDDVICGVLLGHRSFGGAADNHRRIRSALAGTRGRTTAVSEEMLRCAAAGYALRSTVDLVCALRSGDVAAITTTARAVFAIGHESGVALTIGLAAAARAAAAAEAIRVGAA
jgi:hypothetical protein